MKLAPFKSRQARPRILAILLEFETWAMGSKWAYASSYALLDGLRAENCDLTVIPSLYVPQSPEYNPWVDARDTIIGNKTFDQVWVWVTHSHYKPGFNEWLKSIAPVRVGVLMESLTYSAEEIAEIPALADRKARVFRELAEFTHVISGDHADVAMIESELGLPTKYYMPMLPERLFLDAPPPEGSKALFLGTIYGKRASFLNSCGPAPELALAEPPERQTDLPQRFDDISRQYKDRMEKSGACAEQTVEYVTEIWSLRLEVQKLMIAMYRQGYAGVALPAFYKGVTGRIIDIIAASTPALLPKADPVHERLAGDPLDEENVFYYDPDTAGDLNRQALRIRNDREAAAQKVRNASTALRTFISAEVQIRSILLWVQSGTRPGRFTCREAFWPVSTIFRRRRL
ncbi:hypothetical protein [Methylobacterium sp. GC_Met_2]|uniref:hypothetical protein n=1 Tax=Methylobacterium sp. GC_Met_2 TaxID=2937376 RepID=UPI00226B324F|nr:hypothetical protein [Methylobacterium sp. GC_Met_2]